jgi:hypothetical protein
VVGGVIMSIGAIIAIVALLPAFLSVYLPRVALSNTPPSSDAAQTEAARAAVASTHALINELSPLISEKPAFSQIIGVIFDRLPEGVSITNINYVGGAPGTITVSGTTGLRENVNFYRQSLAEDKRFDSVTVPVAALVGILSGNFTVTLTGTF